MPQNNFAPLRKVGNIHFNVDVHVLGELISEILDPDDELALLKVDAQGYDCMILQVNTNLPHQPTRGTGPLKLTPIAHTSVDHQPCRGWTSMQGRNFRCCCGKL